MNEYAEPGFYNADCMKAMKEFPDGFFDLAIVDPPYGINVATHDVKKIVGGGRGPSVRSRVYGPAKSNWCASKFYHTFADDRPPDEGYFRELERVAKNRIIWGGNFMLNYLGAASCMIVWDKKRRGMDQADCEIAWTNLKGQSRVFEWKWNGMLQQDMKHKEKRIHPTQKPVALYQWILSKYAKPGDKILDTHVGSASSLIACHRTGFKAWGFEIDPTYYALASERLEREKRQISAFDLMDGG